MRKPVLKVHIVAILRDAETKEPLVQVMVNDHLILAKVGEIHEFGFTGISVHI